MARRAGFQISKEGIIKVSIKQIARSGFSNFTLSNLSQELNITKAALYWHFKNKDDILLEILKYIELEYISVIKGICDNKESPLILLVNVYPSIFGISISVIITFTLLCSSLIFLQVLDKSFK